jgi:hypothetical protein
LIDEWIERLLRPLRRPVARLFALQTPAQRPSRFLSPGSHHFFRFATSNGTDGTWCHCGVDLLLGVERLAKGLQPWSSSSTTVTKISRIADNAYRTLGLGSPCILCRLASYVFSEWEGASARPRSNVEANGRFLVSARHCANGPNEWHPCYQRAIEVAGHGEPKRMGVEEANEAIWTSGRLCEEPRKVHTEPARRINSVRHGIPCDNLDRGAGHRSMQGCTDFALKSHHRLKKIGLDGGGYGHASSDAQLDLREPESSHPIGGDSPNEADDSCGGQGYAPSLRPGGERGPKDRAQNREGYGDNGHDHDDDPSGDCNAEEG